MDDQQKLSLEEISMVLGQKDITILSLQKQLALAQVRIAELEKKRGES